MKVKTRIAFNNERIRSPELDSVLAEPARQFGLLRTYPCGGREQQQEEQNEHIQAKPVEDR